MQTVWVQIRRPKTDANSVESYDTAAHELQTKPDSYANNVDPDETACMSRLTRIYTAILLLFFYLFIFYFFFFLVIYILTSLFATVQVLKVKNGRAHFRNFGSERIRKENNQDLKP